MKSRCFILLAGLTLSAWADELYQVGNGGVDLYPIPRHHPLDRKDQAKLFDTGGRRSGLVRGTRVRLLESQEFQYSRSSYAGTVITGQGGADIYDRNSYFFRVGYMKVEKAPAQPHMVGREGWVVMEKYVLQKGKWIAQARASLSR